MDGDCEWKRAAAAGGHEIICSLTETHQTRPGLSENAPILKPLSGFDAEQSLGDVAGYQARTSVALAREEIAGGFERHALVDVVSESPPNPWFGLAVIERE